MIKFIAGVLVGGFLLTGSMYGLFLYTNSEGAQVNRCVNAALDAQKKVEEAFGNLMTQELEAEAKTQGLTLEELFIKNCKILVKNGEKF